MAFPSQRGLDLDVDTGLQEGVDRAGNLLEQSTTTVLPLHAPLGQVYADMTIVNQGFATVRSPGFFGHLPANQGASLAVAGISEEPLVGMLAGSIGIDLSSKPSPSQSDREFEEPLEWNGYDQGNFLPNAQGGPSPQPNHRSRPRKRKKFVRDHVADLQWHVSKNEELKDQTCGSRKMVWWLCEQGHEWQASIVSRCKAEKAPACPVCRPKRAAETSLEGQPPRKKKRR